MGKKAMLQSSPTKADANTHCIAAYIREMAHELAELRDPQDTPDYLLCSPWLRSKRRPMS